MITNNTGTLSLCLVSFRGHIDLAKILFEKGAELTIANKNGWTPLHRASSNGYLELVKILLDK